jgi:hypothetical protein
MRFDISNPTCPPDFITKAKAVFGYKRRSLHYYTIVLTAVSSLDCLVYTVREGNIRFAKQAAGRQFAH